MDVLVVGATRGTGLAVTKRLVAEGHTVTAFGRTARSVFGPDGGALAEIDGPGTLRTVDGDVLDRDAVHKAVSGQDAVIVTLGISDNPIKVQWLRRATTAMDVRSLGTAVVMDSMRLNGVRRLLVQTTYGLGDQRKNLSFSWKLTFRLVLAPQIRDSERQEHAVRTSGLDWTLIHPVSLHDDEELTGPARVTTDGAISTFKVARAQVARATVDALGDPATIGATLSVSTGQS
jgi:nucleoside-diphosphate-sugar epimerase